MNAFTLTGTAPDGSVRTLYACAKCSDHVYKTKESADACCGVKKCARCGGPLDRSWSISGVTQCSKCDHEDFRRREDEKEAARFDAARKVREHDGPLFTGGAGGNDGYFRDLEELLDELASREDGEAWPTYAWACHDNPTVSLRYEDIIESATQEAPESFEPSEILGSAELIAAIAEFNEANAGTGSSRSWTPNYKVAVLLPTREELAALDAKGGHS